MRTIPIAAALAMVLCAAPAAHADHKGKIPWVEDPQQGIQQAQQSGKPILYFFTASW